MVVLVGHKELQHTYLVLHEVLLLVCLYDPKDGEKACLSPVHVDKRRDLLEERLGHALTEELIVLQYRAHEVHLPKVHGYLVQEEINEFVQDVLIVCIALAEVHQALVDLTQEFQYLLPRLGQVVVVLQDLRHLVLGVTNEIDKGIVHAQECEDLLAVLADGVRTARFHIIADHTELRSYRSFLQQTRTEVLQDGHNLIELLLAHSHMPLEDVLQPHLR